MKEQHAPQAPPPGPADAFIVVNGADDPDAGIYSDNFYSQRMSPLRSAIRRKMLPWVRSETRGLTELQERWRTPFLDSYFTLTAFAGHPLFFVCILPIMFCVIFGRLYCGMHTRTDIAGGSVIGVVVWAVQWSFHDSIDALMTTSSWTVVVAVILGGVLLIQSIPETMDSCPCVDDGVTTMAVLMGVFPASQHFALSQYAVSAEGHDGIVHYDPAIGLPKSIMRFVFGLAVVFTWRMAAKKLLYIALPPLYGYFNLPSRTHFVPAKTYGNLRSQPIGRVPSLLDLQALADSSIEIVGPQSTMDIHEQFSQSRSSKRSSLSGYHGIHEDIEKKEHCGIRPQHINKAVYEGKQHQPEDLHSVASSLHKSNVTSTLEAFDSLDNGGHRRDIELDESEREAMEKFEAEHPGWARFDVDIVIKTVVYAGIGWLAVDSIPVMFKHTGL
ncbi:unnamed protein product [Mortierella alpina]